MKKHILVITSSIDETVDYLNDKYGKDVSFFRLNVDKFSEYEIGIGQCGTVIKSEGLNLKLEEIFSIYYRKPRLPDLNAFHSGYRVMLAKDIISVINGMADGFKGTVLTRPCVLRKTENKVFQLLYALQHKVTIPVSCISNSKVILAKISNPKRIIKAINMGKAVLDGQTELYHTNYFKELEQDISLMPLYIQEYVTKKYEARVIIINNQVYTVRIDSRDKLDWRRDYIGNTYKLVEAPDGVVAFCKQLLKTFGLAFGAFDFIVRNDEQWVFLEVNPNGQWLWLERELNIPVSESIIRYLTGVE